MEIRTLAELFWKGCEIRRPDRFLVNDGAGYRPVSTDEYRQMVARFAAGLHDLGVRPGDRVALIAYNSLTWSATDYAVLALGAVLVPLYTTLPARAVEYILNDSGAVAVIVENEEQLAKIRSIRVPSLRHVIAIRGDAKKWSEVSGGLSEEELRARASQIRPDQMATLIYTSGTTGVPKGVMLSHHNLVSNIQSSSVYLDMRDDDIVLSFLPLSHVFERIVDYVTFRVGATIAYATSMDDVAKNMLEVRPTIVAGVPRFYEKIYARLMEAVRQMPPKRQKMFQWAVEVGREYSRTWLQGEPIPLSLAFKYSMADFLVLRKIRARTGGRIRYFVSGGAALSREIAEFFYACGFRILEGYGLTETSPVVTVNPPTRPKLGTVGKVIPGVEVRIAQDGEILVRGPNVMMGYYNRPQETAETIKEGWLHTGDIGEFDDEGYLKITDRKKDLFKTSGGKYVAPQAIENQLKLSPLIANVVVIGAGRKFPACLIVPNLEHLSKVAREKGISFSGPEELLRHPEIHKMYDEVLHKVNDGLSQPERIKKWRLLTDDFTIERGEMTPTMKVRRRAVEERYKSLIDEIYREDSQLPREA